MKIDKLLFAFTCFVLTLSSFAAYGLTFTLSDDAIMALDCRYSTGVHTATISNITDVPGPGVQFDIIIPNPHTDSVNWTSSIFGGKGKLAGRDISMFDSFALKFTLLSARGLSNPDAVGPLVVGSMVTQSHYLWGFNPEIIEMNSTDNPSSAISVTSTDKAGIIDLVGFTCYAPYWSYDNGPWDSSGAVISILVEPAPGAVVMTSDPHQTLNLLSVDKCTVAAGSKENTDKISFSGKMNPTYNDLYLTNFIQVIIDSNDMPDPCVIMIPIGNANYMKTGKFSYSGTEKDGLKKSFTLDFKTHKFSFTAQNLDLSGLSSPLKLGVDIGSFSADTEVDETIANGPKICVPINFLMGVRNSLRVDQLKVKYSYKKDSDSFTVKGGFAVQDVDMNMAANPFCASLGKQFFTIPANKFKLTNSRYSCSNVKLQGIAGIASAIFDFNKCTFTLTIKNTTIDANPGDSAKFSLDCAGFIEFDDVKIPCH
jgi:hypothetical protein